MHIMLKGDTIIEMVSFAIIQCSDEYLFFLKKLTCIQKDFVTSFILSKQ